MTIAWIKTHKVIVGIAVIAAVALGSYGAYQTYKTHEARVALRVEREDAERLRADPKTKDAYALLEKDLKVLADAPDRVGPKFDVALDWKTLGGITGEAKYYERSVALYDEIAGILGHKSYVPYLNAGNVYRLLKKFDIADARYAQAKTIAPGEPAIYLAIAEMYRYELLKPSEEVLAVYREAMGRLTEVENILIAYASYLRDLGRTQEAIEAYEKLEKMRPGAYQSILRELKKS